MFENYNYAVLDIPESHDCAVWERFFSKLMQADLYAPVYTLMYYYAILYDLDLGALEIPDTYNYYDLAIEIASDDKYPAYEAAVNSGFFEKGLTMIVHKAAMHDEHVGKYMHVIKVDFVDNSYGDELVSEDVALLAKDLWAKHQNNLNNVISAAPTNKGTLSYWEGRLEKAQLKDPGAPASILGYYLGAVTGEHCSIFCPLGYADYEIIGKAMVANKDAFEAAKNTGLFALACATYVSAALDNYTNWDISRAGIISLLSNPETRCFIPCRTKYVAEKLVAAECIFELSEDFWAAMKDNIYDELGDELKGY